MKKIIALFLFSAFYCASYAQQIQVIGRVLTPDSIPVAGAHIADEKSRIGTTSGENGFFALSLPMQKTALRFSHVAFYEKKVSLSESTLRKAENDGGLWLDVVMETRVRELPAAAISDSKVQIAWEDPKQWILDYELVGEEEMLLLLLEKNKRYLQLVNNRQETISKIPVNKSYQELYRGILGDINMLSADSACQLFLIDEQLVAYHHVDFPSFYNLFNLIVLSTDHYLFTRENFEGNRRNVFYKIPKEGENREKIELLVIYDEEKENMTEVKVFADGVLSKKLNEIIEEKAEVDEKLQRTPLFSQNSLEILKLNQKSHRLFLDRITTERAIGQSNYFYSYIIDQEVYIPVCQISNFIFLFNHVDGKIIKYNLDGIFLDEVEINYQNAIGWAKEIIVNEERTHCFAKFTNVGQTTLREIDPNTGKFLRDIVLEQHAFPSKIKIRDDYVYYRCRDYYEGEDRYFLWKQRIE